MGTLIVGYDGSDGARSALGAAIELGGTLGDALHVVMSYEVSRLGGEVQDYAKALRERAEHVVRQAVDQAAAAGCDITTEIIEQPPADALIAAAERLDARMIVVGSRGESPLKGALVGSTPHKLIQVADRPLLVVPE
jgi:nucleotide-binding universal stress UspA family protein